MWSGERPKDSFPKRKGGYLGLYSHLQLARRHISYFKKKKKWPINSQHQTKSAKLYFSNEFIHFYKMGSHLMISIFLFLSCSYSPFITMHLSNDLWALTVYVCVWGGDKKDGGRDTERDRERDKERETERQRECRESDPRERCSMSPSGGTSDMARASKELFSGSPNSFPFLTSDFLFQQPNVHHFPSTK